MYLAQKKEKLLALFMEEILEKLEIIYKFQIKYLFLITQKIKIEWAILKQN